MSRSTVKVFFAIGLMATCMLPVAVSAGSVQNAATGRIRLEEVEFIVEDGGEIKEKKYLSQKEANETGREYRKRGLGREQRLKANPLPVPRLTFIDESGKVKKTLILGWETRKSTVTIEPQGPPTEVEIGIARHAFVSPRARHAVVFETQSEPRQGEGRQTGKLELYDDSGNKLKEIKLPRFKIPTVCKFSESAPRLVTVEAWTKFSELAEDQPLEQVVAYDLEGAELFRFPKTGKEYAFDAPIEVSPNGRYAALRARKNRKEITLFLDLDARLYGALERPSFPLSIGNEGLAKIGLMIGSKLEEVDAKEYLKPIP